MCGDVVRSCDVGIHPATKTDRHHVPHRPCLAPAQRRQCAAGCVLIDRCHDRPLLVEHRVLRAAGTQLKETAGRRRRLRQNRMSIVSFFFLLTCSQRAVNVQCQDLRPPPRDNPCHPQRPALVAAQSILGCKASASWHATYDSAVHTTDTPRGACPGTPGTPSPATSAGPHPHPHQRPQQAHIPTLTGDCGVDSCAPPKPKSSALKVAPSASDSSRANLKISELT